MSVISRSTAQQIVATVKDVCGQNVNFINENGLIIASTDPGRVDTFHEAGREVILSRTTLEVTEEGSYYGTQKGVNIPIIYNGSAVAAIGITGDPEEVRRYAYLAQRITSLILRERDLDRQSSDRRSRMNYMIRSLVSQDALNLRYLSDFLAEYGIRQNQRFRALIVRLDSRFNPNNLFLIEQQIFQTFDQTGSPLYTFNYPNEYLLIMSERECKSGWHLFSGLTERHGRILQIALGESCSVSGLYRSYQTADLALRSLRPDQSLAVYDDLDLDLLLGSVSAPARESFLRKTISGLDEDDRSLLQIYFAENRSLKQAGERLHLHKNTLQYRLDRIHRSCGYDPRSFHGGAVLYAALLLAQM